MPKLFAALPQAFFSPLASPNRELYAECLLAFYRAFQEAPTGVVRSTLVGRFAACAAAWGLPLGDEEGLAADLLAEPLEARPEDASDAASAQEAAEAEAEARQYRLVATRVLRLLVACGWMGEETLTDFTRVITIAAAAKPFFEALARTEDGSEVEYESHVVAIYSSLCGDAAGEHGHHAVRNAHFHTMLLVESLKVLSQNIRAHYERLLSEGRGAEVGDILRLHYDHYLEEVVDRAYARLKTQDNLSRFRPRIARAVNAFLADEAWMGKTALAMSLLKREPAAEARRRLTLMLEEIRDQLRALDPVLDDIDRRNMLYARSSLERIRARLREDSSLAGRLGLLAKALARDSALAARLRHRLERVRWIGRESRYRRWFREEARPTLGSRAEPNERAAMERAEAELRLRVERQLTSERIAAWLEERSGGGDFLWAHELALDMDDLVRVMHASVYAEGRPGRFPWALEWKDDEARAAGWRFRRHGYRRRR